MRHNTENIRVVECFTDKELTAVDTKATIALGTSK
jgi:hypothetical protein